jgi:hypothetical protein
MEVEWASGCMSVASTPPYLMAQFVEVERWLHVGSPDTDILCAACESGEGVCLHIGSPGMVILNVVSGFEE